jgi:hypothetical protein
MITFLAFFPHITIKWFDEFLTIVTISGWRKPPGVLEYHTLTPSITVVSKPIPRRFVINVVNGILEPFSLGIVESSEIGEFARPI